MIRKIMANYRQKSLIFLICLLVFITSSMQLSAKPNHYEEIILKQQVLKDFRELIDIWTEELYFEMYSLGNQKSKKKLTQGEFAQRMVDLQWKPTLKPLEDEEVKIVYRNYAIIYFIQKFENKVNQTLVVRKQMMFSAVLENQNWRFDLTKIINIPYEGQIPKVKVIKKKEVEKKETKEKVEKKEIKEKVENGAENNQNQPAPAAQNGQQQAPAAQNQP